MVILLNTFTSCAPPRHVGCVQLWQSSKHTHVMLCSEQSKQPEAGSRMVWPVRQARQGSTAALPRPVRRYLLNGTVERGTEGTEGTVMSRRTVSHCSCARCTRHTVCYHCTVLYST